MRHQSNVGNKRIHIERAFRRYQEWKILKTPVKVHEIDLFAAVWSFIEKMSQYDIVLIREHQ